MMRAFARRVLTSRNRGKIIAFFANVWKGAFTRKQNVFFGTESRLHAWTQSHFPRNSRTLLTSVGERFSFKQTNFRLDWTFSHVKLLEIHSALVVRLVLSFTIGCMSIVRLISGKWTLGRNCSYRTIILNNSPAVSSTHGIASWRRERFPTLSKF